MAKDRSATASPDPGGLRIFLNYRRDDAADATGRLYDALAARFGPEQVFMDIDNIPIGVDFQEVVDQAVDSADVVLVVIGQQWLSVTDRKGQRRVENPDDFVRIELEAALARGGLVVPVLVQGVAMPSSEDLPEELKGLARRNAHEMSHAHWQRDLARLVEALEGVEQEKSRREREEREAAERDAAEREENQRRAAQAAQEKREAAEREAERRRAQAEREEREAAKRDEDQRRAAQAAREKREAAERERREAVLKAQQNEREAAERQRSRHEAQERARRAKQRGEPQAQRATAARTGEVTKPSRFAARRKLIVGAAALLVVVAGATGVWILSATQSNNENDAPDAGDRLLAHVPAAIRQPDCSAGKLQSRNAEEPVAYVSCPTYEYLLFRTRAAMDKYYESQASTARENKQLSGACQSFIRSYSYEERKWSRPGAGQGRMICSWTELDQKIRWTTDNLLIYGQLTSYEESPGYEKWRRAIPVP